MGIRLLFLLLALAIIWMIVRFYWVSGKKIHKDETPPQLKSSDMVSCHHCGLHIPAEEAIQSDDHWFCCQEHADAGHDD